MQLGWRRGEVCTGFWCGNLWERDHWGRPGRRWEDNINMDLVYIFVWVIILDFDSLTETKN
jgi:hypothetical protein